jgi:hypothetical protein
MNREAKTTFLTLVGTVTSISGLGLTLALLATPKIPAWAVVAILVLSTLGILVLWYFGRGSVIFNRIYLTWAGASKTDFFIDLVRTLALFGLAALVIWQHGAGVFDSAWGRAYVVLLAVVLFHAFVYPFVRRPGRWDAEYKRRKSLMTAALIDAAASLVSDRVSASMRNIEANALDAIKSYLEYSVLDREGNNFNVNLIVSHPKSEAELVCICRTDHGKRIPTYYSLEKVPTVAEAWKTGKPLYKAVFDSPRKTYKMIWLLPIAHPSGEGNQTIGLVGIDSTRAQHLDLVDDRESLLFNILPYIGLLRFAIVVRTQSNLWDDVL